MGYRPLPPEVTVKESGIEGLGLFSNTVIYEGTNLGMTHYKQMQSENGFIRTPLGGFINHSEIPNCETILIGKSMYLMTKVDIMPEEEITLKYNWYKV